MGQPMPCDICHKRSVFYESWRMTKEKQVVCPKCVPEVSKSGKVQVSI
jgi:hypothetical protein